MPNPLIDHCGETVECYWNFRKKQYSVRLVSTGLVVGHADTVSLMDCMFKVSEAGRQRVLRDKRKNVHAVVRGTLKDAWLGEAIAIGDKVTYNPYRNDTFVLDNQWPVFQATIVVLTRGAAVVQRW